MKEYLQNCRIQELEKFSGNEIRVDILRLDLFHPVISGNKWFKLRYYLEEAASLQKKHIATFGGAYSNHIAATAFAAREMGFQSTGFIRGEKTASPSPTLVQAKNWGMNIIFISREVYPNKSLIMETFDDPGIYWIPEGGYGKTGALGAATILDIADTSAYSHILCASGTGTMMAGLIKAAAPQQEVMAVSVIKNHLSLEAEVSALLEKTENEKSFSFVHGYHFGGYAKHPQLLIEHMRSIWEKWQVPTDIVYTSKLLFAVKDLLDNHHFSAGSRLLLIHSGGLQGNQSLPSYTLPF